MYELRDVVPSFMLIILTLFLLFFFTKTTPKSSKPSKTKSHLALPKPYPIIGHLFAFIGLTGQEIFQWLSKIIACSPTSTIVIHQPFGGQSVYTGNPVNVEHILKTKFHVYQKGRQFKTVFGDLFGGSVFTEDGDNWKFQRQILAQEFNYKSLQKFVEKAVEFEVSERLIPVLEDAAKNSKVIDLQDILQRFAFDNVCTVAFGYDPGYLSLPLPEAKFTEAFDECITICHERFHSVFPTIWKTCRFFNIGSEKRLKELIKMIREFCATIVASTKQKMSNKKSHELHESNLLVKLLKCDQYDDELVIDIVIGFILAGRDTSSSALTWFFWLIHKNKHVENQIIQEIIFYEERIKKNGNLNTNSNFIKSSSSSSFVLEALKGMTYTHAALSETMRLYPPVPVDLKQAANDDILPDGTKVKKGSIVGYFAQSMGWSEKLWGKDWAEFRPERWLKTDLTTEKLSFVPRDAYSYPVFLAGPRICLGKEMAYLQMKSVVAAILSRFKVVPAVAEGTEPVYFIETVAIMHGGFPVRIEERV
ncbi:hypothetical protein RND81_07G019300 [Saponaria officinalis]|uniref:Cytochrome P450 n=1 Tax=Saponaria officinalis TaxID=3572 RepID=A0AAW1JL06_SAPOF